MIFVALSEAAERGELMLVQDGFCRWHRRRDGVLVIRELLIMPRSRGQGIGRRLVEKLFACADGGTVLAKCPSEYPSNGFWAHMGFQLVEAGKVNTWRYPS